MGLRQNDAADIVIRIVFHVNKCKRLMVRGKKDILTMTSLMKSERKKWEFIERAQEHRCDSLTRLLAIVCSDSTNEKKRWITWKRWEECER